MGLVTDRSDEQDPKSGLCLFPSFAATAWILNVTPFAFTCLHCVVVPEAFSYLRIKVALQSCSPRSTKLSNADFKRWASCGSTSASTKPGSEEKAVSPHRTSRCLGRTVQNPTWRMLGSTLEQSDSRGASCMPGI